MNIITAPLGALGLLAIAYLALLFGNFSRRLSAVTKMRDYYRWFPVGSALITVAATSQVIRSTAAIAEKAPQFLCDPLFAVLSFYLPLVVGVMLVLVLVWHYWGWILKEKIK